jgi:hypothetical protein
MTVVHCISPPQANDVCTSGSIYLNVSFGILSERNAIKDELPARNAVPGELKVFGDFTGVSELKLVILYYIKC